MHRFILSMLAVALGVTSGVAIAQGSGERGSTPPGLSRDGSGPADGAIKGGSIQPDLGTNPARPRDVARCQQLAGELRAQCLRDLDPGTGGGLPPQGEPRSPAQPGPGDPPPQNPRGPR
jgi:hypothetical protein